MADYVPQEAVEAKATTVGYAAVQAGPFTDLGSIYGEPTGPAEECDVQTFRPNSATSAAIICGDTKPANAELDIAYPGTDDYETLRTQYKVHQYFKFLLGNGDWQVWYGVINKVGACTKVQDGGYLTTIGFTFVDLVASGKVAA